MGSCAFYGGLSIQSHLKDGPLPDLNLMFDPILCEGDVITKRGPLQQVITRPAQGVVAVHVLSGAPKINTTYLAAGDTAFIGKSDMALALNHGDALLEIGLRYLDQSNAIKLWVADG